MNRTIFATACIAILAIAPFHARADDAPAQGTTLAQESPDQWRSSKLVGVPIYGPDDKSVGKITDMLMGKDGKVQAVVIGVGGFLGIGQKDVAIPFDAVNFSDKPITPPAMPVDNPMGAASTSTAAPPVTGPATATPDASGNAGVAPSAGLGVPAATTGNAMTPAGGAMMAPAMPPSTAYPDHGVIAMNKDQLKQAPSFTFAR